MKIGVLGLGSMGARRVRDALKMEHEAKGYDPIHCQDPNVICTDSEETLLAWNPDAIIIASPAERHAGQFFRVIDACPRARVLVEKPLALSVYDYMQHIDSIERYRIVVQSALRANVGYTFRFHPAIQFARKAFTDMLALNRPVHIELWVRCNMRAWPGRHYADILVEMSHELDLLMWLTNSWTLNITSAERASPLEVVVRGTFGADAHVLSFRLHFDGGFLGYDRGLAIWSYGSSVRVLWDAYRYVTTSLSAAPATGLDAHMCKPYELGAVYRSELEAFLNHRRDCSTLGEGLAVLSVVDKIKQQLGEPSARLTSLQMSTERAIRIRDDRP